MDRQRGRIGFVGDFGGRIDKRKHRGHIGQALPNGAIHHAQHVQWPKKLRQQGIHHHHVACGKLAA